MISSSIAKKVKAIQEWPQLKSVSEVHSFHSMQVFIGGFVKDFITIVAPLTEIIKKDKGFFWSSEYDHAFPLLKKSCVMHHY